MINLGVLQRKQKTPGSLAKIGISQQPQNAGSGGGRSTATAATSFLTGGNAGGGTFWDGLGWRLVGNSWGPFELVSILLMEEILHHLGWLKPYKKTSLVVQDFVHQQYG